MNWKPYTIFAIALATTIILQFPNSEMINMVLDYQIEELDDQSSIQTFFREDDTSRGYLDLFSNGQYAESMMIIYSCGVGVDFSKGPWNEVGKYEIIDNIIYLYPRIIKERRNIEGKSGKEIYQRKFSIPKDWVRELKIIEEPMKPMTLYEKNRECVYELHH